MYGRSKRAAADQQIVTSQSNAHSDSLLSHAFTNCPRLWSISLPSRLQEEALAVVKMTMTTGRIGPSVVVHVWVSEDSFHISHKTHIYLRIVSSAQAVIERVSWERGRTSLGTKRETLSFLFIHKTCRQTASVYFIIKYHIQKSQHVCVLAKI